MIVEVDMMGSMQVCGAKLYIPICRQTFNLVNYQSESGQEQCGRVKVKRVKVYEMDLGMS